MTATPHLQKQFKELSLHPIAGFRVELNDDLFKWTVWFSGPKGTLYEGGQYRGELEFPQDFPYNPPKFRILSKFFHPNVYEDGKVCISILHPPGTDPTNSLETAQERWTPIQSIASVLISIISLLADPDPSEAGAPANVDALAMYRKNRPKFEQICRENAQQSLRELPADWVPPIEKEEKPVMAREPTLGEAVFIDDDGEGDYGEDGESVNPPPKKSSGPYAAELEQVRSMGIGGDKSDEELTGMLVKYKGDISRVIEALY